MGTAGRGPQIAIQAPEERPKSNPRPTEQTLMASTSSVVGVLPGMVRRVDWEGNFYPNEGVTQREPYENQETPRWMKWARTMAMMLAMAGVALIVYAMALQ